jgi:hypothetical protein
MTSATGPLGILPNVAKTIGLTRVYENGREMRRTDHRPSKEEAMRWISMASALVALGVAVPNAFA